MGSGGAGNKQASRPGGSLGCSAQPWRTTSTLCASRLPSSLVPRPIEVQDRPQDGIQSRILGQPRRAPSVCQRRLASRAHWAWLIARIDTPNPTRQRPCCRRTTLRDTLRPLATTTNHSLHHLSNRNPTAVRPAINPPPWVPLLSAMTTTRRLSSRNNISNDTAVLDTVPHPLQQLAVLLPLHATPSHHHRLPPITARDLDLPAITTVPRFLKTNVHLPSHHLRTLIPTAVRHYGHCSWPWTRSATAS